MAKRIIDYPEATDIAVDDYLVVGSDTLGTRKLLASKLGSGGGGGYSRDVLFSNTGTSVSEITNLAHPVTDYDEIEFIIGTTQSGAQMAYRFDATDFVDRFPYVADTSGSFPFFAPSLFNGNYIMKIIMGETASAIKCFTASLEYFVEIAGIKY